MLGDTTIIWRELLNDKSQEEKTKEDNTSRRNKKTFQRKIESESSNIEITNRRVEELTVIWEVHFQFLENRLLVWTQRRIISCLILIKNYHNWNIGDIRYPMSDKNTFSTLIESTQNETVRGIKKPEEISLISLNKVEETEL